MAASDYAPNNFKNRLHLAGRPQMGSRTVPELCASAAHFRSSPISRHSQGHSACLKGATNGLMHCRKNI